LYVRYPCSLRCQVGGHGCKYMGTSLIRKRTPLGPYCRPMRRVLGGWVFFYEEGSSVVCAAK